MILKIKLFLYKWIVDYYIIYINYRRIKWIGLDYKDYLCFKHRGKCINDKISETKLFQIQIQRSNSFWYTQSVLEIFEDEVYKFNTPNNSPTIIDCGANIGLSIIYFKRLYPNANITAFEPDPDIFDLCKYNCNQFNLQDVEIVNAAVWKENTEMTFFADGALGGNIMAEGKNNTGTKVKAEKLSSYLDRPIDFLKIDIEGAEYEVLKSCKDLLGNVQNLFVEYHSFQNQDQILDDLLRILSDAGFRYYIKEAWVSMKKPFVDSVLERNMDLQLNIFAYRPNID
jgi:FkbM family methyltransferase